MEEIAYVILIYIAFLCVYLFQMSVIRTKEEDHH